MKKGHMGRKFEKPCLNLKQEEAQEPKGVLSRSPPIQAFPQAHPKKRQSKNPLP
jgi:hypothetical protein